MNVSVLLTVSTMFASATPCPVPQALKYDPRATVCADFNGDGKMDYATIPEVYDSPVEVRAAVSQPDGSFKERALPQTCGGLYVCDLEVHQDHPATFVQPPHVRTKGKSWSHNATARNAALVVRGDASDTVVHVFDGAWKSVRLGKPAVRCENLLPEPLDAFLRTASPNDMVSTVKGAHVQCANIVSGDFNGDGVQDYAMLRIRGSLDGNDMNGDAKSNVQKGERPKLIAALSSPQGWRMDESLPQECRTVEECGEFTKVAAGDEVSGVEVGTNAKGQSKVGFHRKMSRDAFCAQELFEEQITCWTLADAKWETFDYENETHDVNEGSPEDASD